MLDLMKDAQLTQLEDRFGLQRVEVKDPGIAAEVWAFRHQLDGAQLVTVCTVGEPRNLCLTTREADLPAGVALLRAALTREWTPGRVWLNDQPLLLGTHIQGLVALAGDWLELIPLTEEEAELVAVETISAITIARGRQPLVFTDLFRSNAFPEVTDADLAAITVFASKDAEVRPLRKIRALALHRFAAFTNEESAQFLADPDKFERKTALELIPRLHGSRLFFAGEKPGKELTYGRDGWVYSVR